MGNNRRRIEIAARKGLRKLHADEQLTIEEISGNIHANNSA